MPPSYHLLMSMNHFHTLADASLPQSRIFGVMDHIDANIDESLPLEDLAAHTGLSPWHFHRLFRASTGEPVHQYIQRLRMEKGARELLQTPQRSVTDIALDCGFGSPSTFARAFRAHFGMNARQWRRAPILNPICPIPVQQPEGVASHQTGERQWTVEMDGTFLELELRRLPRIDLAYTRAIGPYCSPELYSTLLHALSDSLKRSDGAPSPTASYTIFHDHPGITPPEKCRVSMGFPITPGHTTSPDLGTLSIPPCWQVCCTLIFSRNNHWGAPLKTLTSRWLPQEGLIMSRFPPHILLSPLPDTPLPEGKIEIHIPVVPAPGLRNPLRKTDPASAIGNAS